MIEKLLTFALVGLLAAGSAHAQIANGDFENGLDDWNSVVPNGDWSTGTSTQFPLDGAYGEVISPFFGDGGLGCITQTFECGQAGTGNCTVRLFYRLDLFDAGPNTGLVRISANGIEQFESPTTPQTTDWTEVEFTVPCGTIQLDLCLEAFAGNQSWKAGFDNVTATCEEVVSGESSSWGAVKSLF